MTNETAEESNSTNVMDTNETSGDSNSSSTNSESSNEVSENSTSTSNATSVDNAKAPSNVTYEENTSEANGTTDEENETNSEGGVRRKREAADGSSNLSKMVIPMVTGFVGVQPKKGLLAKSVPCECEDPLMRLRKDYKTGIAWNDDLSDPATKAFAEMKSDLEKMVFFFSNLFIRQ